MSTEDVDIICEHVDMLQVGARNMQNFALLRRLATVKKPILLKRGPSATVKEWLLAAEYLLSGGNHASRALRARHQDLRNRDAQHVSIWRPSRWRAIFLICR